MTLKMVSEVSGVSATHVSEIEGGRTSPTMGTLIRIAAALERPVAFLLEDEALPAVSRIAPDERVREKSPSGSVWERLTTSIPGARIDARRLTTGAGAREILEPVETVRFAVVLDGPVTATTRDLVVPLESGDVFRAPPGEVAWIGGAKGNGHVLVISVRDRPDLLL